MPARRARQERPGSRTMAYVAGHIVVTGAFSYTGAAVAGELIRRGFAVRTLTNRQPPPGREGIPHAPLRMDVAYLADQLKGADAFINTYWVRLPHGAADFGTAVRDSRTLIEAAVRAGVSRLVHVSVSNAEQGRNLGYYAGKAEVERSVRECGVPHAIVRPTLMVGPNDVLTNNIAWFLRRFPAFLLPDGGRYRLQPVLRVCPLDHGGLRRATTARGRPRMDLPPLPPFRRCSAARHRSDPGRALTGRPRTITRALLFMDAGHLINIRASPPQPLRSTSRIHVTESYAGLPEMLLRPPRRRTGAGRASCTLPDPYSLGL